MTATSSAREQLPSRNPIPLSAAQEQEVKKLYHKRIRGYCAPEIKEFAECVNGRTISTTWACRQQKLAMNSCVMAHAGQEEEDLAREEFFAGALKRRAEREERERRVAEQAKFHREWWGSDERGQQRQEK